jgi:hypothetical protein
MASEQTRERWLERARDRVLRDVFRPQGLAAPDGVDVAVSCSWPSRGALSQVKRTIGQCWAPKQSEADRYEIQISPYLADVPEVLATLAHELAHAVAGVAAGHRGLFVKVIRQIGLTGKPTQTEAGPELAATLATIAEKLGAYPHRRLNGQTGRKQGTRLFKVSCPDCGYTARITRVW